MPGCAIQSTLSFSRVCGRSASILPSPLDRNRLIRRVTLDLTGLPPSPAEVDAFLNDKSPDAYEKVVDRLLASPAYGERWAAKWLDVVRYADTNGFELDLERPNAWRYRDYVIQSFNSGKPYDRFVREQIAGDEMFPGDPEALVATGYLRAGSEHLVSGNIDPQESRQEVLTEIATNVGQTFLGMTINCARCHNHKFDPILQRDFYALQSVFAGAKGKDVEIVAADEKTAWEACPEGVQGKTVADRRCAQGASQTFRLATPRRTQALSWTPSCAKLSTFPKEKRTAEQKRFAADAETQLKPAWDEIVAVMPPAVLAERAKLRERLHEVEATAPDPLAAAYAFVNTREDAPQSYILRLGDPHSRLDPVEPAVPFVLKAGYQIPTASTGRRTALANWLASPDNPLTARVMVNRIWQFRMGDGMVRTPNDFGTMGDKPESHALLDWLAAEFVSANWSVKAMDRLIVTSSAYRQSSGPERREGKTRSAEPTSLADEPQALRRRDDPRRRALRRRHAQSQNGRPPGENTDRTGSLRPDLHRVRTRRPVARQPRQERAESPRHLSLQQTQRAPPLAHRLRSARYHHFLPRAPRVHARAASPDAVQFRLHAGSLAGLRRAARKILRRRPRLPDRSRLATRALAPPAPAGSPPRP